MRSEDEDASGSGGASSPIPSEPAVESFVVPAGFPEPSFEPSNEFSPQRVELGRRLFFDARLSGSNAVSCATCHAPELAFGDGLALSDLGVSGVTLARHTPPLFNLAWAGSGLFWDGGAKNLESLAFGPITHVDEMDQDLGELFDELNRDEVLIADFALAFDAEPFGVGQVAMVLSQYVRTLVSADSPHDEARSFQGALSEREARGLGLVEEKCGSCHAGELFTDHGYHNNGLDAEFSSDHERLAWGRGRITNDPADIGKYRTPSLRNVALTAPYMHDGRFSSLREVLEHYRSGVVVSATLADEVRGVDASTVGIPLDDDEIEAIVAFLEALSGREARRALR